MTWVFGMNPKRIHESSESVPAFGTYREGGACDIIDLHEAEGAAEAVTVSMDDQGRMRRGKKIQLALSEKISNLRRRRPHSEVLQQGISTSGNGNAGLSYKDLLLESEKTPTESGINETVKQLESLDDSLDPNSQFHTLLYTKGGTYNEHVIHAAKDLGRALFSDLELKERKQKINEQINILQKEIDATTQQRLEFLNNSKEPSDGLNRTTGSSADLTKVDDKLQALAVLMLHYCAGLQHCLDLEESNVDDETLEDDNEDKKESAVGMEDAEVVADWSSSKDEGSRDVEEEQMESDQHNKELLEYLMASQNIALPQMQSEK